MNTVIRGHRFQPVTEDTISSSIGLQFTSDNGDSAAIVLDLADPRSHQVIRDLDVFMQSLRKRLPEEPAPVVTGPSGIL